MEYTKEKYDYNVPEISEPFSAPQIKYWKKYYKENKYRGYKNKIFIFYSIHFKLLKNYVLLLKLLPTFQLLEMAVHLPGI